MIPPTAARICVDCDNLVSSAETCPLCNSATDPHPDSRDEYFYCMECGDQSPASECQVATYEDDPYLQDDEGDLWTVCPKCIKKEA